MIYGLAIAPRSSNLKRSCFHQWQCALVDWVRSDRPDLSNRQLAVLLVVVTSPAQHTLRGLADYLNITKTAVLRALNQLVELDYLRRVHDEMDRRSLFIVATTSGKAFVNQLAEDLEQSH